MEVNTLVITETTDEQVVVLKEVGGEQRFPIVIGSYEALALDRKLRSISLPRPLTHDLVGNILTGLDVKLLRVVVTDLKNNTFYAKLVIKRNGKEIEIDSRPSDAIVLAAQFKARIYVEEKVLKKASGEISEEEQT